jgi:hypothetical protein
MRKRCKGKFICSVCGTQIIPENFEVEETTKHPYVRVFGKLMKISENELHNYVGFKIEYK